MKRSRSPSMLGNVQLAGTSGAAWLGSSAHGELDVLLLALGSDGALR